MLSLFGPFILAAWLFAAALSFYVFRDSFSPDKLVLVALGVFFGDIFFNDYSLGLSSVYMLLITSFVAVIIVFTFALRNWRMKSVATIHGELNSNNGVMLVSYKFFWLVSLPALAAQFWMIQLFGGIQGYINVLALSVVNFEGLGWLTSIIRTFSTIDLIYFSYLVTRRKLTVSVIVIYVIHFLVFVMLALLTGSRGSLLGNFLLMALVYHHSVRPIRTRWLLTLAASTLLMASVLEVAREGVAVGEDGLVTGLSEKNQPEKQLSFRWAKYGTIPLDLVLQADQVNKHYGFTYLTVLTNLIPRAIWPAKPDTGGNLLTKEYTGDAWGGTSFLSTGIIPEAIINFGRPLGIAVGTLQFCAVVSGLLLYYFRYKRLLATNDPYMFVYSVRFAYICWGMVGLIVGEFTNVMICLLVQITTVWAILQLIRTFQIRVVRRVPKPAQSSS